ncbi:MAG: manganese efflux pump MntP family protein [Planctomycetota bacterium]
MGDWLAVLLIAVAVSMDAVAVSIAQGLRTPPAQRHRGWYMAACFGLFQMIMPLLGALVGAGAMRWMAQIDHWIALALLLLIGGKMCWEGWRGEPVADEIDDGGVAPTLAWGKRHLLTLSVATSIDAFGVGFSIVVFDLPIWLACAVIGVTTFVLAGLAYRCGCWLGRRTGAMAEILGGIILIAIGLNIVYSHLEAGA